jgi:hypothetical protein
LTRHLRICKVMQLPRIGEYVPFIFYLRESSNSKGSCGKPHHGQTFAGSGIENENMVNTTGEYETYCGCLMKGQLTINPVRVTIQRYCAPIWRF